MATSRVPVAPPASTNRVHYYHANACAMGGSYTSPVAQNIPPQASLSLSPSGGYGSATAGKFQIGNILSFASASTEVSGEVSPVTGGWLTKVTATLVGLNVPGVVAADKLVAQIQTEHPQEGDYPTVTFAGTTFVNLTVAGCAVDVTLNMDICDQSDEEEDGYPSACCIDDSEFLDKVALQYTSMNDPASLPAWVADRTIPSWVTQRYAWDPAQDGERTSVLSTIVQSATVIPPKNGPCPVRPFLNALELPGIGRVFLGELLVNDCSYNLTMVRLELNGKHGNGTYGGPISGANGTTIPPG